MDTAPAPSRATTVMVITRLSRMLPAVRNRRDRGVRAVALRSSTKVNRRAKIQAAAARARSPAGKKVRKKSRATTGAASHFRKGMAPGWAASQGVTAEPVK